MLESGNSIFIKNINKSNIDKTYSFSVGNLTSELKSLAANHFVNSLPLKNLVTCLKTSTRLFIAKDILSNAYD